MVKICLCIGYNYVIMAKKRFLLWFLYWFCKWTVPSDMQYISRHNIFSHVFCFSGFNSMVGSVMGFSILISAEVFKHHADVWFLDGTIGVLIGLIILAYGVK